MNDVNDDRLIPPRRCEAFAEAGCKVYATARREETMVGFSYDTIEKVIPLKSGFR